MSPVQKLALFKATIGKQATITFAQFFGTRELKFALDYIQPYPALSLMAAAGLTGVPCSSLQYNLII